VFHPPGTYGPAGGRPAFQAAGVSAGHGPPGGDTIITDDKIIDADSQVRKGGMVAANRGRLRGAAADAGCRVVPEFGVEEVGGGFVALPVPYSS
jgi:hypothetical protein